MLPLSRPTLQNDWKIKKSCILVGNVFSIPRVLIVACAVRMGARVIDSTRIAVSIVRTSAFVMLMEICKTVIYFLSKYVFKTWLGYVFWTKEPTGCECEWNRKSKAKECACCYPGGKQCKVADFKDRCIGPDDDWRLCSQPKKIKSKKNSKFRKLCFHSKIEKTTSKHSN